MYSKLNLEKNISLPNVWTLEYLIHDNNNDNNRALGISVKRVLQSAKKPWKEKTKDSWSCIKGRAKLFHAWEVLKWDTWGCGIRLNGFYLKKTSQAHIKHTPKQDPSWRTCRKSKFLVTIKNEGFVLIQKSWALGGELNQRLNTVKKLACNEGSY